MHAEGQPSRPPSACCFSSATIQRGLEDDLAANSHCAVSTVLQRGIQKIRAVVCGDVLVGRWRVKVLVISNVEELTTEFETNALRNFECFEDVAVEVEITCRVVRIAVRNKRAGGLKSALIKPCACNPPLKSCWLSITNMTKCIQWRLTPRSKGGFVPEPERLRGCLGRQG
jgi:hypothetical protein